MKHAYYESKDVADQEGSQLYSMVELGGLNICKTCGGAEGSLTTDCPGENIPYDQDQKVYKGEIDFVESLGWIKQTSRHSPAYWRERNG